MPIFSTSIHKGRTLFWQQEIMALGTPNWLKSELLEIYISLPSTVYVHVRLVMAAILSILCLHKAYKDRHASNSRISPRSAKLTQVYTNNYSYYCALVPGYYIFIVYCPFRCSEPCSIRHWWWVPLIAPMVGAAVATPCYWFLIEANHPAPMEEVKTRRDLSQHIETAIE